MCARRSSGSFLTLDVYSLILLTSRVLLPRLVNLLSPLLSPNGPWPPLYLVNIWRFQEAVVTVTESHLIPTLQNMYPCVCLYFIPSVCLVRVLGGKIWALWEHQSLIEISLKVQINFSNPGTLKAFTCFKHLFCFTCSASWNFHCRGIWDPWLILFLNNFFASITKMFLSSLLVCVKTMISAYWIYIL